MYRTCAWCGKGMGQKPPYDDQGITHGICLDCLEKVKKEGTK